MKKTIRVSLLTLALAVAAYADGDMQNGKTPPPPPPPGQTSTQLTAGDMQSGVAGEMQNGGSDAAAAIVMNLFQTMLNLF